MTIFVSNSTGRASFSLSSALSELILENKSYRSYSISIIIIITIIITVIIIIIIIITFKVEIRSLSYS